MASATATEDELLRMSVTGTPPPSQSGTFDEAKAAGNAAFANGDYEAALSSYAVASAADPSSPVPHTNSALVFLRIDRPFDAERAATTALELLAAHPTRPRSLQLTVKTLLRRAAARATLGQDAQAELDLREILEIQPGHEEASTRLREMHAEGRIQAASRGRAAVVRPCIEEVAPTANGHEEANGFHVSAEGGDVILQAGTSEASAAAVRAMAVSHEAQVVPRGTTDFDRAWRTLRNSPTLRGQYLLGRVGSGRLRTAVGETLTADLVREMCDSMRAVVADETTMAETSVGLVEAMTELPRFGLTAMFFEEPDKCAVKNLFYCLREAGASSAQLDGLSPKFAV